MPGFFVSNMDIKINLDNQYPDRCVEDQIYKPGVIFCRNTLKKFMNDKAIEETDTLVVVSEGVLLNKVALFKKYQVDSIVSLIDIMYRTNGEAFFEEFRGSFSGALYDKCRKTWIVYTNHMGDSPVFYALFDNFFIAGSDVRYILTACREKDFQLTFDEQAAYQMLTFGFMADNSTYAEQIKRLRGGTYLYISEDEIEIRTYHRFEKHPDRFLKKTETEIVEELDTAFRNAVSMEYAKDTEYGYRHISDMSGGLDSRMNAWVAHSIAPKHIQLITYCKANWLDELIAKEIAAFWADEILVKSLDDASFLYDIDEIVHLNGGLALYTGITGGKRMLESLNMDIFGIEHTGMIGDVVIGSYCSSVEDNTRNVPSGMYSERFKDKLKKLENLHMEFYDHEIYLLYTRGFYGMSSTYFIRRNFTEPLSPFMDVDFFQLCMDIPLKLRVNHRLYKKWIISKYPDAALFRWEKTGARITDRKIVKLWKRIFARGPQKIKRILHIEKQNSMGMNPIDYWIANNEKIRIYMDDYEKIGYRYLPSSTSKQLIQDMKELYGSGNASEKAMVLTVLSSVKLYFGEQINEECINES